MPYYAYMWTLPNLQGGFLKWALKFLLKHTTFNEISKSLSSEFRIFLYILYIFDKPPWNESKISLMPFIYGIQMNQNTKKLPFFILKENHLFNKEHAKWSFRHTDSCLDFFEGIYMRKYFLFICHRWPFQKWHVINNLMHLMPC